MENEMPQPDSTESTIALKVKARSMVFLNNGSQFLSSKYNTSATGVWALGQWVDTGSKEQFSQTYISAAGWKRFPSMSDEILVMIPYQAIAHIQLEYAENKKESAG
jgi:hypothetical protein